MPATILDGESLAAHMRGRLREARRAATLVVAVGKANLVTGDVH